MIAIHAKSGSFVPEWLAHCQENGIPYKEVDCFASDIIQQLDGCQALLWHWAHHDYRAQLFARQLIASVEEMGLKVFPSTATCWHYDDKVGQKYLLEAIGAPLIPTHVFYDRQSALQWVEMTTFPKVWKLRGGAGSQNVRLVHNAKAARRVVRKAFGNGWSFSRFHVFRERLWRFRRDRDWASLARVPRSMWWAVFPDEKTRNSPRQKNYAYFQDFVPDCDSDIRIVVVGERAFAIKRMVREGDFRASGSGSLKYEETQIPIECVRVGFEVTAALGSQCCAFDFVILEDTWFIVEISYAFSADAYRQCPGFWDSSLNWHAAPVQPEKFIFQDVLQALEGKE